MSKKDEVVTDTGPEGDAFVEAGENSAFRLMVEAVEEAITLAKERGKISFEDAEASLRALDTIK